MKMTTKMTGQRIIRMQDLPAKVGFQRSTIYELIAKGKFPEPFKLVPGGRAPGWLETTVDDWIESREQLSRDNNTK
jgi:prophage regulatory protein